MADDDLRASFTNITEQEWLDIDDRLSIEELGEGEHKKFLYKLLAQLERIPQANLQENQLENWSKGGIQAQPVLLRAKGCKIQGKAVRIEKIELGESEKSFYLLNHYYRLRVEEENGADVLLYLRELPDDWNVSELASGAVTLQEPVEVDAVFYRQASYGVGSETIETEEGDHKVVSDESDKSKPLFLFVGKRLAWYPNMNREPFHLDDSLLLLGQKKFDVSLFDGVRKNQNGRLSSEERACFFELLERANELANVEERVPQIEFRTLYEEHRGAHGKEFEIAGVVRRVTKVAVEEETLQEKLGKAYYQIDLFMELGDLQVVLDREKELVYRRRYPVTVCLRELPEGLSVGENLSVDLKVRGFYYRWWAYPAPFVSRVSEDRLAVSPLFIGSSAELVEYQETSFWYLEILFGILFLAIITGVCYSLWKSSKKSFEREDFQQNDFQEPHE
ncbi:MAG: hypothetical protein MPJ24_06215 [Pirellulaceae bacterium]|nr:hypothetical protein [Pirellulaceae bacterium]